MIPGVTAEQEELRASVRVPRYPCSSASSAWE
jgi:hypothetical protein